MTVVTVDDLHVAPDPEQRLRTAASLASVDGGTDLHRIIVRVPDRATNGVRVYGVGDVARMLQRHGRVIDLGVTEKGTIVAAADLCRRRGEVAVWTGHAIGHWSPADITKRGLGGSETAAVRISEQLARMGYLVTLYGDFAPDTPDVAGDVLLRHFDEFDFTRPLDALIGFRNATLFDHRPNARFCALWLEDLAPAEGLTEQRAQNIDRVCAVSGWHKNQILEVHPWLEPAKVAACRNGIMVDWFEDRAEYERKPRVIFSSSPDRGADIILEVWPSVRERVPDAELVLTYARWFDLVADRVQQANEFRQKVIDLLHQPGVHRIEGGLGQKDLAQLMMTSLVWAHPSWYTDGDAEFHETSCISSIEAQAAGCVVVASNWGAITESVQHGTLIDGDPRIEGPWRDAFVDAIVDGLTDEQVQLTAQELGPECVKHMGWDGAAEQLAAMLPAATNGYVEHAVEHHPV